MIVAEKNSSYEFKCVARGTKRDSEGLLGTVAAVGGDEEEGEAECELAENKDKFKGLQGRWRRKRS